LTTTSPTYTGADPIDTKKTLDFWVKNIGNTALVVRWTANGGWTLNVDRYSNQAAAPYAAATYTFYLTLQSDSIRLRPSEITTPWTLSLPVGGIVALRLTTSQLIAPPIPAGSLPVYTVRFDGSDV
jgi:hypothetical protein